MDLGPGQVIDRYTVLGQLGQGGMAVVYRVRHNTLGTEHALKVLTLGVPSIQERLIQEGRLQARLQHPNIVSVTDVLDVQGSPGLLMELVRGPSLEDWLRGNRPSLSQALQLFDGILGALREAHRLDIVHRDLKPGNIMLSTLGGGLLPKVTDFGLAKLLADETSPTRTCTGLPMGTPAYMSPEQITDAKSVDQRTDLFALGCILYELVCGQMAFRGANTLEVFNAVAGGNYLPPRQLAPELPVPVVDAIRGCLNQQREHRIQSCLPLAAVLRGESGTLVPSEAPTLAPESGPWASARSTAVPAPSAAAPTFAPLESMLGSLEPSQQATTAPTDAPAPRRLHWWLLVAGTLLAVLVAVVGVSGGALGVYWLSRGDGGEPVEAAEDLALPGEAGVLEPSEEQVTGAEAAVDSPTAHEPENTPSAPDAVPGGPEPDPEPGAPEEPEPGLASAGFVRVDGDAVSVVFIDSTSGRHQPGRLPVGTYDLEARFSSGNTIRQPGRVTVRAGQTITLRCVELLETCG